MFNTIATLPYKHELFRKNTFINYKRQKKNDNDKIQKI